MPIDDVINKTEIIIRRRDEDCLLPSDEEETTSVGTSASGADVMVRA
jgi:hypothetical protein